MLLKSQLLRESPEGPSERNCSIEPYFEFAGSKPLKKPLFRSFKDMSCSHLLTRMTVHEPISRRMECILPPTAQCKLLVHYQQLSGMFLRVARTVVLEDAARPCAALLRYRSQARRRSRCPLLQPVRAAELWTRSICRRPCRYYDCLWHRAGSWLRARRAHE